MSSKSYAESVGHPAFDWWHALNNPTEYEHEELCAKAAEWTTCACGTQCAIIPRYNRGVPVDYDLFHDGVAFFSTVQNKYYNHAQIILTRIEARSARLIAEELAKLNTP